MLEFLVDLVQMFSQVFLDFSLVVAYNLLVLSKKAKVFR